MGLFDKKKKPEPAKTVPTEHGDVFAVDQELRPRQPDPGGGVTLYRLLGVLRDGEFDKPRRYELYMEGHGDYGYKLGDLIELTHLEYAVLSKRHVLVPEDALEDL